MMAFNCESAECRALTPGVVNKESAGWLHRLSWCNDKNIGKVTPEWNWLVGYYAETEFGTPGAIHYTDGGPWFDDETVPAEFKAAGVHSWRDIEYGNLWLQYKDEFTSSVSTKDEKRIVGVDNLEYQEVFKQYFLDLRAVLTDPYNVQDTTPKLDEFIAKVKHYRTHSSVLGVSEMEDVSESLLEKGYKWDKVVDFFVTGSGGSLTDWKTIYEGLADRDSRPIVFRGITKRHIYDWCKSNNRDFYFIDTGYFGNGKSKLWHRVTKNDMQYCGELRNVKADRYIKAHGYTKKFTPGSKILLCPPSDKAMNFYGEDLDTWMQKTLAEIRKHTDREIIVREKKTRKERVFDDTIQQALQDDIHCLVTYNSIAAVEALMEGKPAFVLGQNAASPLCSNDLSKIENPVYPSLDEVMYLLSNLAYHQYTQAELQTGQAWKLIQEWYNT